jgi:chorismate mutase
MKIDNSLSMCLRILIVINTELEQNQVKHVYLKGAANLRKDLK